MKKARGRSCCEGGDVDCDSSEKRENGRMRKYIHEKASGEWGLGIADLAEFVVNKK